MTALVVTGDVSMEENRRNRHFMHAMEVHQTNFTLDIFTIAVVKKVSPQRLRREEYKFIDNIVPIP